MQNYDVIKKVGSGSFGNAFLVRNKKDKIQYVLKQVNIKKMSKKDVELVKQEVCDAVSATSQPTLRMMGFFLAADTAPSEP